MATPVVSRLTPVPRNQGVQVPGLWPAATWIDARVLAAGVAESYTIPADASGNKGTMLRINSNAGPLYVNFNGTAVVPVGDVNDGTSSIILRTDIGPVLIVAPLSTAVLSMLSPGASIVTLEAWS